MLPINVAVARCAARLRAPDPRPERDALLAATAITRGMTVVTRNERDFAGAAVVYPWSNGLNLRHESGCRVVKRDTRVPVTLTSLVIRRALNVRTTHPGR